MIESKAVYPSRALCALLTLLQSIFTQSSFLVAALGVLPLGVFLIGSSAALVA